MGKNKIIDEISILMKDLDSGLVSKLSAKIMKYGIIERKQAKQEKARELKREIEKCFPNFELGMNVFTDKRWKEFWKEHTKSEGE